MKERKSLQSRIRGWFPQEPRMMVSARLNVDSEKKQPPLMIPPEYKVSTTKVAVVFAVFWIIFYGFMFCTIIDLDRHPVSAFQAVAWIIVGLSIGAISALIFTKNQLGRLSKDYKFFTNGKDLVLLLVPQILFFIFGFIMSWYFGSSTGLPSLQGVYISIYFWVVSFEITRIILFVAFEKREICV
jgi:hypothetical protein